jgi:ATP-dependent Clp protease ATP-binding subunit ClpA
LKQRLDLLSTIILLPRSVQQAVEKSFDVKVQTASTAEEKDVLLNLEDRIHERMINQTQSCEACQRCLAQSSRWRAQ